MVRKQRAFAMTDYLVAVAITLLLGLALGTVQYVAGTSEDTVTGTSGSESRAREVLNLVGDDLRNAQQFATGAPPGKAVIAHATATSVTLYANTAGQTVRYYLDGSGTTGRLMKQIAAGAPTVVFEDVASLSFQYLVASGYSAPADQWTLSNSFPLSAPQRSKVGAVIISVTSRFDLSKSYTRTLSTKIRLRNSPLP
jgi:Tfp pilus assembly protein PilW